MAAPNIKLFELYYVAISEVPGIDPLLGQCTIFFVYCVRVWVFMKP